MRRSIRRLLTVILVLVALGLGGGFLGAVHPVGDSLAVFRGVLTATALVLALLLIWTRARYRGLASVILGVAGLAALLPHWVAATAAAQPPGGTYAIYQKNLSAEAPAPRQVLTDILRTDPHFITLQEVTEPNRTVLDDLPPNYVTRHWCAFNAAGGVAIASIFPPVPDSEICVDGFGLAAVTVETLEGPMRVISLHLHWPWPQGQQGQLEVLMPYLDAEEAPTLIGGDFNMVRWSATLERIKAASGTEAVGASLVTLPVSDLPFGGLSIDHVLAPTGGTLERRPLIGSDHFGLLARFARVTPRP
ncbi:MAG: endonuclease/exonuclease/phosphatase family protein [Pseudomonadota bacterium]